MLLMVIANNNYIAHTRIVVSHNVINKNIMFVCTEKIDNPDPDNKCLPKLNEKLLLTILSLLKSIECCESPT